MRFKIFYTVSQTVQNSIISDVSFHYQEARPILENLSFKIPPGSRFAVVGASGNGKSTLAKLLFRLFDPVQARRQFESIAFYFLKKHVLMADFDKKCICF